MNLSERGSQQPSHKISTAAIVLGIILGVLLCLKTLWVEGGIALLISLLSYFIVAHPYTRGNVIINIGNGVIGTFTSIWIFMDRLLDSSQCGVDPTLNDEGDKAWDQTSAAQCALDLAALSVAGVLILLFAMLALRYLVFFCTNTGGPPPHDLEAGPIYSSGIKSFPAAFNDKVLDQIGIDDDLSEDYGCRTPPSLTSGKDCQ